MKVAYCGYDFFYSCLEYLVNQKIEVMKVFTYETDDVYNFNSKLSHIARENNIPIQKEKITDKDMNFLIENGCDLVISAAYPYKIPTDDRIKGINIHPTLLPDGKGVWPLPYIILNDHKKSGVTIHKLAKKIDSGDILIQEAFLLFNNEDLETLSIKSQIMARKLLEKLLLNFDKYWQNAKKQEDGSYWEMPTEDEMTLDFDLNVNQLKKIQRAFSYMDTCAVFNDTHWLVRDINGWIEEHSYKNGTVVHETNKEVLIAVNDGYVCLKNIQKDKDYE